MIKAAPLGAHSDRAAAEQKGDSAINTLSRLMVSHIMLLPCKRIDPWTKELGPQKRNPENEEYTRSPLPGGNTFLLVPGRL